MERSPQVDPDGSPLGTPSGRDTGRLVVVAGLAVLLAVIAAIVVLVIVVLVRRPGHDPRTVGLDSGSVVFADSFSGTGLKWPQTTLPSGTVVGYAGGGYIVDGRGPYSHFVSAPYSAPLQAMAITTTATVETGDPGASGFGVRCDPGTVGDPAYAFFLDPDGTFLIDRYDSPTARPFVIKRGFALTAGAARATSLTGACIVVSTDGSSSRVRLVLAVGNATVADVSDSAVGSGSGWTSALVSSTTAAQPSLVDFTRFAIRNLDG